MVIFTSEVASIVVDAPLDWVEPGTLNGVPGVMYSFDGANGISASSIQNLYAAGYNVLAYAPSPEEFHLRVFVPKAEVSIAIV